MSELALRTFSGTERAAVLMMLVGEEEAAAILQKLEPDEVRELGRAMYTVADVSEADVEGVLAPLAQAGALFARVDQDGELADPGYRVTVDGTVNPLDALARNELSVLIAVRLSPLAQLIQVEIVKVPLTAGLS